MSAHCYNSTFYHFYKADFESSDTVDGFATIAREMKPLASLPEIKGGSLTDVFAIAAGWVVLAIAILYPASQVVALALTAIAFALRPIFAAAAKFIRESFVSPYQEFSGA